MAEVLQTWIYIKQSISCFHCQLVRLNHRSLIFKSLKKKKNIKNRICFVLVWTKWPKWSLKFFTCVDLDFRLCWCSIFSLNWWNLNQFGPTVNFIVSLDENWWEAFYEDISDFFRINFISLSWYYVIALTQKV